MATNTWNNRSNDPDDTSSDNTDARWLPIPDEVWFSSPAGDFGMENEWHVQEDILEQEQARQYQEPASTGDAAAKQTPSAASVKPTTNATASETVAIEGGAAGRASNKDNSPEKADEVTDEATRLLPNDVPTRRTPAPATASTPTTPTSTAQTAATPTQRVSDSDATVLASPLADAAAEAADRTTVVGGGNPYRVGMQPASQRPPVGERTQVWSAPYAGQNGYNNTAAYEAPTTRRSSILKRRDKTQRKGSDATANNQGMYDESPVPAARGGRRRREHKRARHGCLSLVLWLVMFVVAGIMLLRTLPSEQANGSMVPELVAFVPLLFVPIIVCLLLALWWHRRLLAVCCVAALAVMAWWHAGFFIPTARVSSNAVAAAANAPSTDDNVARIMTINTNHGMASAQEIVDICREQNVEILCLQEIGGSMLSDLEAAGINDVLPYHVVSDEATEISNGGRNGIWSVAPMDNISTNLLPIKTSSMPAADITIGNQTVRIVSVHPNSPVRGAQDLWDDGLATISQLQDYDHSYVIMGDFNSTWNHARFRELLGTSFVDASQQSGEGFHMTFPSSGPVPPVVELDHILYTQDSGVVVSELATVKVSGTDHMALLGTLETT